MSETNNEKKRVTGIGGIFFRTEDSEALKTWYGKHLGLKTDMHGAAFKSRQWTDKDKSAYLQWSTFNDDSKHFEPSKKSYMINYRVEDLEWLVGELKKEGVTICDEIETYDYGKFVHIMDPEGNKIELWEPVDKVFDKYFEDGKSDALNF